MNYLLVVDDSPLDRQLAKSLLERRLNYRIEFASTGWEALEHIESQLPLVVITDLQMPEMDGLKLTETIHRHYKTVPVILMTAHGSEEIAAEALLRGAADYIPKSQLAKELYHAVESVLAVSEGT
jgi:CheY-like chemotaxis protein